MSMQKYILIFSISIAIILLFLQTTEMGSIGLSFNSGDEE